VTKTPPDWQTAWKTNLFQAVSVSRETVNGGHLTEDSDGTEDTVREGEGDGDWDDGEVRLTENRERFQCGRIP
jgi:hypothetical protein